MSRRKGFILSEEQKAKMQVGRQNKKLGIVKEKPVKPVSDKKPGRPKGFKLSQEQKDKMRMGMIHKHNNPTETKVYEKPVLIISRKWQTGFDFWPVMRKVLRPLHRYTDCHDIERMIVQKDIWDKREEIIKILENYFIIQLKKLKVNI